MTATGRPRRAAVEARPATPRGTVTGGHRPAAAMRSDRSSAAGVASRTAPGRCPNEPSRAPPLRFSSRHRAAPRPGRS
ncbi:hypothetical protein QJS66_03400 [Kocuria rhizophila]|nr:hypothetical protein QJS66_03400 [Kocuria rhizophila]